MNRKYGHPLLFGLLLFSTYLGSAKQIYNSSAGVQIKPVDYIAEFRCFSTTNEAITYYILETQPNLQINFSANKNVSRGFSKRISSSNEKNAEISMTNNSNVNKQITSKRNFSEDNGNRWSLSGNLGISKNENGQTNFNLNNNLSRQQAKKKANSYKKSSSENFSQFNTENLSARLSIKQNNSYIFPNFPLALGRFYEILTQKYIFIPGKEGFCSINSEIYIHTDKPVEALAIIKLISKLYHFQYFFDGNTTYKPTYVVLNRKFKDISDLIKFLAQQIQANNPNLIVKYDYKNKYFAIYNPAKREKILEEKGIEKREREILANTRNLKAKVLYLKNIKVNDFVKILKLKYSNIIYTVDPLFNTVTIIAPQSVLDDIERNYSFYLKYSKESSNLISKIFYLKYGDIDYLLRRIEKYLSERGLVKKLSAAQAIEIIDYPHNIAKIERIFGKFLSQKPVKIKITVKFVEIDKNFAKTIGINWGFGYGQPRNYQDFNLLGGFSNTVISYNSTNVNIGNNYSTLVTPPLPNETYPSLYLNISAISEKLNPISVAITAGEDVGLAKELSSPSIILLNGEAGEVSKGVEIPYQSVDENGNIKIEYKEATLGLSVRPVLLSDGRILLTIKLSRDSVNQSITVNGQPAINTFTVSQNIIIPNGGSIVIGGVLEKENENTKAGIPGLMNIPLLGWLFKTQNWRNNKRELYIVVTANLVNN